VKGIEFGVSHHGRVLIGDEMGVGKSVQALAICYLYRREWPLLIVSPSSLKLVWRDEIRKWFPMIPEEDIEVVQSSKDAFDGNKQIYIMSYDLAKNVQPALVKKMFKIAVADEAHYLKNKDAKRTMILSPLLMQCKRVVMLSGTPILSKPMEIFNLIHILRPDLFPGFKEFGYRYCEPKHGYFGIDWSGATNTDELHLVLSSTVMVRRLKNQVLQELPSKRRQKIEIETDNKAIKELQNVLKNVSEKEIKRVFSKVDFTATTDQLIENKEESRLNIMVAYKLTGLCKVKGINDFLNTLIENDIKFILFAHHIEVLNGIEEHIKRRKVGMIRIDGNVPPSKRHELVNKFQTDQLCRVALLSLTATSQGITLTAASTVVFAEMNWTPAVMEQAEDRVHRIGQMNSVNIYYLYAENTIDSVLYKMIKSKNEVLAQALNGQTIKYRLETAASVENGRMKVEKQKEGTIYGYFKKKKTEEESGKKSGLRIIRSKKMDMKKNRRVLVFGKCSGDCTIKHLSAQKAL
jgi:SWI/SNF-related matrix-associated actin-dependent regulator 1 of chromatin subfamily A